eukprot:3987998-Amphidinium_carterae.2
MALRGRTASVLPACKICTRNKKGPCYIAIATVTVVPSLTFLVVASYLAALEPKQQIDCGLVITKLAMLDHVAGEAHLRTNLCNECCQVRRRQEFLALTKSPLSRLLPPPWGVGVDCPKHICNCMFWPAFIRRLSKQNRKYKIRKLSFRRSKTDKIEEILRVTSKDVNMVKTEVVTVTAPLLLELDKLQHLLRRLHISLLCKCVLQNCSQGFRWTQVLKCNIFT